MNETNERAAVVVDQLSYHYPDGRHALRGVNLTISNGECVALVGPNGAGKSTLLLHLNGLLPDATRDRAAGKILIDGLEIGKKTAVEIRRRVGLVFQDPDDQLFAPTVLEDVAFGPLNLGMSRPEARRVALESLDRVGLIDLSDRPPRHLSFGERKRACLAGVLACSPTVLVLDEPTANLDPRARRRFMTLIRDLTATKLIATHDLEMVVETCPRSIVIDSGVVVADGLSVDLLADSALMEAHGLETPASLAATTLRRRR